MVVEAESELSSELESQPLSAVSKAPSPVHNTTRSWTLRGEAESESKGSLASVAAICS